MTSIKKKSYFVGQSLRTYFIYTQLAPAQPIYHCGFFPGKRVLFGVELYLVVLDYFVGLKLAFVVTRFPQMLRVKGITNQSLYKCMPARLYISQCFPHYYSVAFCISPIAYINVMWVIIQVTLLLSPNHTLC